MKVYRLRARVQSLLPERELKQDNSMANDELKDSIKEMMVENLMLKTPREEIADDLPLFGAEGLGLDSIDALELVVSLEKRFGVTIPNSEVAKSALGSVNTIADYILANRK